MDDEEEAEDFKVRGGRPPKDIDADNLRKLRFLQCTEDEIAAFFGVSTRTIKRRIKVEPWKGAWEDGINEGKVSLRRQQWKHAAMPNSAGVQMTIHLSKHWLGQVDKPAAPARDGADAKPMKLVVEGGLPDDDVLPPELPAPDDVAPTTTVGKDDDGLA